MDKPIIRYYIELALLHIQGQMRDLATLDGHLDRFALEAYGILQKRSLALKMGKHQAPISGHRSERGLLISALDSEPDQGLTRIIDLDRYLSQGIAQLWREVPLVIGVGDLIHMLKHERGTVCKPQGHYRLARITGSRR